MWRKLFGLAFIALGVFWTARGVWQWNDAPLQPERWRYNYFGISRQREDVGYGPATILVGIAIYRRGWKA